MVWQVGQVPWVPLEVAASQPNLSSWRCNSLAGANIGQEAAKEGMGAATTL